MFTEYLAYVRNKAECCGYTNDQRSQNISPHGYYPRPYVSALDFFKKIYLFIFGCVGSLLLRTGFL